jgi:Zn ribbon nucleic-acid-binding protein
MQLPLPNSWPVRCAKCRHSGTVSASVADLATKQLKCVACGHRQPFAPETVVRAPRRPNGWRARQARAAAKAAITDPLLNDRLDDLIFAG